MAVNPFTPAFGGRPQHFFGRDRETSIVEEALDNEFSPHRALFVTGNRGFGKTALLEQASQIATRRRWLAIDVHSSHASTAILKQLVEGTSKTVERSLAPSALGVSVGKASASTTNAFEPTDLSDVLLDKCRSLTLHDGVFISIDEVQKIPEADMENVCSAVQMSLRKGYPVMLMLAGLPGAKEKVSSYPGCTFMQRAEDLQIGSLLVDETVGTFESLLKAVPELAVDDTGIWRISEFSQGHPYLMQLIGYYLVELFQERAPAGGLVDESLLGAAEREALAAYRANVLDPAFSSLGGELKNYLAIAVSLLDNDGRVSTGAIAKELGKTAQQCSSYRDRLLKKRYIVDDSWGYVRLGLPHTVDYFLHEEEPNAPKTPRRWTIA